jgi:hypothetical protein
VNWLKLFRSKTAGPVKAAEDIAACLHSALVPRWDRAEDIGQDDRATSFRCDVCQTTFTKDEAIALRAREAQRLRDILRT